MSIEDRSYITELPVGLFGSVSPTLVPAVVESVNTEVASVPKPESVDTLADDWKCVYRKYVLPQVREDDDNVKDCRMALLPGCRIRDQSTGYILGDIANILYTPRCSDWDEFEAKGFSTQEKDLPVEVFAQEMKLNLMGFYYRLSRYPVWTPCIHRLSAIIVSEYTLKESIGRLFDYHLKEGETFTFKPDAEGEDMEDWSLIFKVLGRRLLQPLPVTLWCDLFALTILYSQQAHVQVMFQPCFAETRTNKSGEGSDMRLRLLSPSVMTDLNPSATPFPEKMDGRYIIIPVYLLNDNPCVIQSRKSVMPNYVTATHAAYRKKIHTELALPNSRRLYQEEGDLPVEVCDFFNKEEVDTECQLDVEALMKQLDSINKPEAVSPRKHNTEADDLGGDIWTEKQRALNDSRVELDMEVNEWNPEFMYPSLGMPHDDRYLAHIDPPKRDWWTSLNDELPEDFVPQAAHIYTQQELTALSRGSTSTERKARSWAIILQEARSLSSNMLQLLEKNEEEEEELRGNVRAIDGDYTDQEYVDLACLVDPGRELQWNTEQNKKAHTIEVIVDSFHIIQPLDNMSAQKKNEMGIKQWWSTRSG